MNPILATIYTIGILQSSYHYHELNLKPSNLCIDSIIIHPIIIIPIHPINLLGSLRSPATPHSYLPL